MTFAGAASNQVGGLFSGLFTQSRDLSSHLPGLRLELNAVDTRLSSLFACGRHLSERVPV